MHEVASVLRSLPPRERRASVIVTSNYGEAGAIDRFGPAVGLPRAYSGHNSYGWWGAPHPELGTTVAVGLSADELRPYFRAVTLATRVHNRYGVGNDEEGAPILVCTGQRVPWSRIWSRFEHYS